MKTKKLTSITIVALLISLSANAQIIFKDTFDTAAAAVWGDVNADLVTRQAGGTTNSSYTTVNGGTVTTDSVLLSNQLLTRVAINAGGSTSVSLDTDFGPNLLNTVWSLSFSTLRNGNGIGNGWSGFGVGVNSPAGAPFANGFGFIMTGLGGWQVFNGGTLVGNGNIGYASANKWYDIKATIDEAADTVSIDFTDAANGTTNLGTFSTSAAFNNFDGRYVDFKNFVASMPPAGTFADMWTENVQIEVLSVNSPPEIGNVTLDVLPGTNALSLTWATGAGFSYMVESKLSLLDASWSTNATYTATGESLTVTTAVDQVQSFYRVIGN